jgi:hydrogenase maturation protein HypF
VSYDGQAAIELEACAEAADLDDNVYPFEVTTSHNGAQQVDFAPLFPAILAEIDAGVSFAVIARRFHASVVRGSVLTCLQIAQNTGCDRVVLSGGVFQNRLLTDLLYTDLTKRGLQVFTHRLVPPNDGGIALGQAAIAGWKTRRSD